MNFVSEIKSAELERSRQSLPIMSPRRSSTQTGEYLSPRRSKSSLGFWTNKTALSFTLVLLYRWFDRLEKKLLTGGWSFVRSLNQTFRLLNNASVDSNLRIYPFIKSSVLDFWTNKITSHLLYVQALQVSVGSSSLVRRSTSLLSHQGPQISGLVDEILNCYLKLLKNWFWTYF